MEDFFNKFINRIEDQEIKKIWLEHTGVKKKFFEFFYYEISKIKKPKIVEFGVRHGVSTSLFLDLCEQNNGELYSVDINDYAYKFKSKKWHFFNSTDDNFEFLKKNFPNEVDIIFLDTIHKADHVLKILKNYFEILRVDGYFIIDDTSWIPYIKNNDHDHFYKEVNNKETFDSLLQLYSLNSKAIDIRFNFTDTGSAIIKKNKKENLVFYRKNISRQSSIKNHLRVIFKFFRKLIFKN